MHAKATVLAGPRERPPVDGVPRCYYPRGGGDDSSSRVADVTAGIAKDLAGDTWNEPGHQCPHVRLDDASFGMFDHLEHHCIGRMRDIQNAGGFVSMIACE